MVSGGKLVVGLMDVELQLQKAALAVKLHLKILRKETQSPLAQSRESKDQIIALSSTIEAVQSELRAVTSEILELAAKSLAVDTSVASSAGEETEIEDEMAFEQEKPTVPVDEATEGVSSSGVVKFEPQQQNPPTVAVQQGDSIVKVELNTDPSEDVGTTFAERVHADTEREKRPRLSLESDGRGAKRPRRIDVTGIVDRYANLAIISKCQHKDTSSVVPPEIPLLKQATTETNAAVLEFLEAKQSLDGATTLSFCAATKHTVHIICSTSKDLVESSWIEGAINGITNIARLVVGDAMMEHHDELLKCASRLRRHLIKSYGYASYQGDDDEGLNAIEERVEWYRRDARQLRPNEIARPICSITTRLVNDLASLESKGFVRTGGNWERFTALGNLVAEWMEIAKDRVRRRHIQSTSDGYPSS